MRIPRKAPRAWEKQRAGQSRWGEGWGREQWFQKRFEECAYACFTERPLMPTRLLKLERPTIPRTGQVVEQTKLSDFAGGSVQPLCNSLAVSLEVKHVLTV